MNRILNRTIAVLLISTAAASAQLNWGTNGAGGTGTWDTTTSDWYNGTTNTTWDNNIAIFGGTAGTVTISTSVQANQLIFNSAGYVIAGNDLVSPTDSTFNVTTNADATISALVQAASAGSGLATFVKDGTGTLTLTGAIANYAQFQILNGNLDLGSSSNIGTSGVNFTLANSPSATLTLGVNTTVGALNGGGSTGAIVLPESASGGVTLTFSTNTGSFAGSLQDNGTSLLSIDMTMKASQTLTGTNTYSGTTKVTNGTLIFAGQGSALNTSAISISNNGTLILDNSATNNGNRLSDTAVITNTGNLVFIGNSSAPASETTGPLHIGNTGTSYVTMQPNAAQPSTLTFSSIGTQGSGVAGVTVFRGANLGAAPAPGVANILATTTPTLLGSGGAAGSKTMSIVPFAVGDFSVTGSGTSFVTYDINGIRPLADSEYASNDFTVAGANVSVDSANTVSTTASINSLRLKNGANITGSGTVSVGSGMLLQLPGVASVSTTTLDFGANAIVLDIQGTTTISSAITGTNSTRGLDKLGTGRLVLSGASTYAGPTNIAEGVVNLQNGSALGATGNTTTVQNGAALELQGGIHVGAETLNLTGFGLGTVFSSAGVLNSISGNNIWDGNITINGQSVIGVETGSLTLNGTLSAIAGFSKVGNGSLIFSAAVGGGVGPMNITGGSLVSTVTSGIPFSQQVTLTNAGLEVAPSGSGGAISLTELTPVSYNAGSSLEVSKGSNTSATFTVSMNRGTVAPTLVVIPGSGMSALGVTEKIKASMTVTNGIVPASVVGQDNNANLSGTFLNYNASNGLIAATYSTATDLNTATNTTVFQANAAQTLTANRNVYALQDNGQVIDLGAKQLSVGSPGTSSGIILNGGTIQNGNLGMSGSDTAIYTSLAGGTISAAIETSSTVAFFGPGKLTLSSTNNYTGNTYVNGGNLNLQGSIISPIFIAPAATLSGTGKTTQAAGGGTISPGNGGAGILTLGSVQTQESPLSSNLGAYTNLAFEFTKTGLPNFGSATASGNDLLHLTNTAVPFSGVPMTSSNEVDLYFNVSFSLQTGQNYVGGFFTDRDQAFDSSIDGANFKVFVADPLGTTTFDGVNYDSVDPGQIAISTVPETADFGSGPVNGYAMQVQIVPEPGTLSALLGGVALLGLRRRKRS